MAKKPTLVWYASYGSNLFMDRFLCYIKGGQPEGSTKRETGSRDHTLPRDHSPVSLPFALYFSGYSSRWDGAGAFINTVHNEEAATLGRMYLITEEQFEDVVRQENGIEDMSVDVETIKEKGNIILDENAYYGNLLYAGDRDGYPIFTFTNPKSMKENTIMKPSERYLAMLIRGYYQTHGMEAEEIVNYLIEKPGVEGVYTRSDLLTLTQALQTK